MITDPISDMLTRIRNASAVKKTEVILSYSKMKYDLAKILEREGYLNQVEKTTEKKFPGLRIVLKYHAHGPAIIKLCRVSKPGHRVYVRHEDLPKVLSGMGLAIVSTPNGLMTNREARKRHLGGEVICEVY